MLSAVVGSILYSGLFYWRLFESSWKLLGAGGEVSPISGGINGVCFLLEYQA